MYESLSLETQQRVPGQFAVMHKTENVDSPILQYAAHS
jgi:hypothetical protein